MPIMAAAQAVLNTYELLEQILLHLPWKEKFAVQRVSPFWKDLIQRSQILRQRMWIFSPKAPLDAIFKDASPTWPPEYSEPLVTFPDFVSTIRKRKRCCARPGHAHQYVCAVHKIYVLKRREDENAVVAKPLKGSDPIGAASFDTMFLTWPPVKTLDIHIPLDEAAAAKNNAAWWTAVCSIHVATGVTTGDFMRAVEAVLASHECATGEELTPLLTKVGFGFVDPRIPVLEDKQPQLPLKPLERCGLECEWCEIDEARRAKQAVSPG